jgi:hypothetical protein
MEFKSMKKIFIIFAMLIVSSNSITALAAGWSGEARVIQLYSITPDLMLVKLENFSNPDKCLTNADADIIFNAKVSQPWFAMLLSAYMSGKKVSIYVNGVCTPWWAGTSFAEAAHVVLVRQ